MDTFRNLTSTEIYNVSDNATNWIFQKRRSLMRKKFWFHEIYFTISFPHMYVPRDIHYCRSCRSFQSISFFSSFQLFVTFDTRDITQRDMTHLKVSVFFFWVYIALTYLRKEIPVVSWLYFIFILQKTWILIWKWSWTQTKYWTLSHDCEE